MASSTEFHQRNFRNVPYTILLHGNYDSSEESTSVSTNNFLHVITTIISVMLFSCTLIMVMAFSLGPKPPIVQLNSLTISNFTISNTKLAANWVANFSVYNPNVAMELSLERIESMIFYKENDALSITSVEGFDLDLKEENDVQMKFATSGYEGDQPIVEYPVLREIEEDKKRGTVRFSMRLSMWATYKAGYCLAWRRRFLVNPYCLGLNVRVVAGNGSLIGGGENRFCDVVVMLSDS